MKLIVIGSSGNSHIVLNSPYVSSYHAEILLLDNGDIILEDKGSRNGTFLNENKLKPNTEVSIKRGDNIRFADTMLDWNQVPKLRISEDVKEMRGIGTNFRNRYKLTGEKVSRFHATFKKTKNGKWYIQDHSTNGTTINGNLIPKEQDIRIKRGDKILCAGVPVINPCEEGGRRWSIQNPRTIAASIFMILALCLGVKYSLQRWPNLKFWSTGRILSKNSILTDNEIYERYKSSTVLLFAGYYYEVSAGELNLENLGRTVGDLLPTKVIVGSDGKLKDVSRTDDAAMFFGTGFFVSKEGRLITNLHIAKPWLFDETASKLESIYKLKIQSIANLFTEIPLGAFVSEVKVEGKLKFIGLIPNGEDFDDENFLKCKVVAAGDNPDIDVALIRTVNKGLPDGCTFVNPDSIEVDEKALAVASHIYTMGFPAGLGLQDLKSNKGIQLYGRGGSIIQESTQYSFGFDAASYGGASGSPIFNDKGKLIGVLNAGFAKTQGFNYGIKARFVKELLENEN